MHYPAENMGQSAIPLPQYPLDMPCSALHAVKDTIPAPPPVMGPDDTWPQTMTGGWLDLSAPELEDV